MTTGRERREFPRVPQFFEAHYHFLGELTMGWRRLTPIDLSAGGMRSRSEEPVETGTLLEIQLKLPNEQSPVTLQGRVVWSRMASSGETEMGIEFMDVGPEQRGRIDEVVTFLRKRKS